MITVLFIISIIIAIEILPLISMHVLKYQYSHIKYDRKLEKNSVEMGEEVKVTMTIENRSKMRLPFVLIKEYIPKGVRIRGKKGNDINEIEDSYIASVYINKMERLTKIYSIISEKRGIYFINKVDLTIGDEFGLIEETKEISDSKELVVYPSHNKLTDIEFTNSSLTGDQIIKKFIFEDPLMVKGIREYTVNDRMKDIHWNSSLKAGNLMVKEYDSTCDRGVTLILNVQCGEPSYATIDSKVIEHGISLAMSIADYCISNSIDVSLWTNSYLKSIFGNVSDKIQNNISTLEPILDMGARIDYSSKKDFSYYLQDNINNFVFNKLYFIITPFLDDISQDILRELSYKGINIKIIDISRDGIDNIESIDILKVSKEEKV